MRLELGTPVSCTDGPAGELADVVIDPSSRRVTHVVVEPHHQHALARLVPVELVGEQRGFPPALGLRCTAAELRSFEPVQELADLRLDQLPARDGQWDVGVEDAFPAPAYGYDDLDLYPVNPDPHVWLVYDRVPKGEIELRGRSPVAWADGGRLGHVEGFVVDAEERVTDVLVERGHLWARSHVAVPMEAVEQLGTDEVRLRLTRDEAGS